LQVKETTLSEQED